MNYLNKLKAYLGGLLSRLIQCISDHQRRPSPITIVDAKLWKDTYLLRSRKPITMIDDQDLGFIANFLGIFIFALVIAYHYVTADPKYESN
ncbi:hypothetical protein QYF36_002359 [Acer negundo]|nr:hypothetical protein QYF36_002359 [Acer negundo]